MPEDVNVTCPHRCECAHKRVRYCPTCKVVHCLDCREEWRSWYYQTTPWHLYSNTQAIPRKTTTATAYQAGCDHTGT